MIAFKINQIYRCRSVCDYNCIFSYTVIKRTAKTITIRDSHGRTKRKGVKPSYNGLYETCMPEGRYSMCPVLNAE